MAAYRSAEQEPAMIIREIVARKFEREVPPGFRNPVHAWRTKPLVLLFVLTDDGRIGTGEAMTGISSAEPVMETIERDVAPRLIGRPVFDVRSIGAEIRQRIDVTQNYATLGAALSAVDIALWDLIGQKAGLPLYQLFGGHGKGAYGYGSGGLYRTGAGLDALRAEMRGHVEAGMTGVKMKIGGVSLAEDIERIRAVRETIGPKARLMIDAAGAYAPPDALKIERLARPLDIYWFEAPIAIHDMHGLAELRHRIETPIAAHELYFGRHSFEQLISARAVDFVQFNLTQCGGFTEAFAIASRASSANLRTTIQAAGTFVGLLASLHYANAVENCDSVEIHGLHQWLTEFRSMDEYRSTGSDFRVGDGPGLGLARATADKLLKAG
jgi:L-alanine-DL-glutamate epimerase-like enolase superfamily enzyme